MYSTASFVVATLSIFCSLFFKAHNIFYIPPILSNTVKSMGHINVFPLQHAPLSVSYSWSISSLQRNKNAHVKNGNTEGDKIDHYFKKEETNKKKTNQNEEKGYACDRCFKRCKSLAGLKSHKRTHHDGKPAATKNQNIKTMFANITKKSKKNENKDAGAKKKKKIPNDLSTVKSIVSIKILKKSIVHIRMQ